VRPRWNGSSRRHDGSIRTEHPNQMWGTDAKQFWTRQEGSCWFFGLMDHCNDEILGWHASVMGDRFACLPVGMAALEPVHQAVKSQFGSLGKGIVLDTGLFLRSDHGSQYDSRDFQAELRYLGLVHSPAFVRSPECNGIIERFNRTLQEQVFDIHCFETIDEARIVIAQFIDDYNRFWLIQRLGYRSPMEFKADQQNFFLKCA
jgi:transposase InsO family protein